METTAFTRLMKHHCPQLANLSITTAGRRAYDLLRGLADREEWHPETGEGFIFRERSVTGP